MATLEQCKLAVAKGKITTGEYVDITGEEYMA
jgi:hypothetical protein